MSDYLTDAKHHLKEANNKYQFSDDFDQVQCRTQMGLLCALIAQAEAMQVQTEMLCDIADGLVVLTSHTGQLLDKLDQLIANQQTALSGLDTMRNIDRIMQEAKARDECPVPLEETLDDSPGLAVYVLYRTKPIIEIVTVTTDHTRPKEWNREPHHYSTMRALRDD